MANKLTKIKLGDTTYHLKDNNALPLSGGTLTGKTQLAEDIEVTEPQDLVTKEYVDNSIPADYIKTIKVNGTEQILDENKAVDITIEEPDLSGYLPLTGGTLTGTLTTNKIQFYDKNSYIYIPRGLEDVLAARFYNNLTIEKGTINFSDEVPLISETPTLKAQAANKKYVDDSIAATYIAATAAMSTDDTTVCVLTPASTIQNGAIIKFTAPAAGLKISSIQIGSDSYDIVDGRGRSVLAQAGFFAANSTISCIVDTTNKKLWLQNIAMIHVGDSVVSGLELQENATVNDAFDKVVNKLSNLETFAASAVTLKGIAATAADITSLTDYKVGWTYKATSNFAIADLGNIEPGDAIVCMIDYVDSFKSSDWTVIQGNTDVMMGATTSTSGASGLVPIPSANDTNNYLRGDGTWSSPDVVWGNIADLIE